MMSLHNLWRFRVAFAAALALEGGAAVALGAVHVWPGDAATVLALAGLLSAALVFPWGKRPNLDAADAHV